MTTADRKTLGDAVCAALGVEQASPGARHDEAGNLVIYERWPSVSESDGVAVEVLVPAWQRRGCSEVRLRFFDGGACAEVFQPGHEWQHAAATCREALLIALAKALGIPLPTEAT